jgi:membrane fusion protein, multidrug efflux system
MTHLIPVPLGRLVTGGLLLLTAACSSPGNSSGPSTAQNTRSAALPAEIYIVRDTLIREQIKALGTLFPNEEVVLVSETPKRLVKINFQEGAFVKKGQLLFQLDDADLQAQLKKLQAQRKIIANDEARTAALLKLEGVSRQEYERVAGSVETIDADIELVNVEIEKTQIRAPFNGRTGIRRVSTGAFVNPNTPLVSLEDIEKIKLEFAVPEKYANSIALNQPVSFRVENSPRTFTARIVVVEPKIDQNTRSLFIRAIADNTDFQLIPGSSATVELSLKEISDTYLIPSQAVIPTLKGNSVLKVRNGRATSSDVEIGLRTNLRVQVTQGLAPGDTIMVTNILRAKEGVSVQPTSVIP